MNATANTTQTVLIVGPNLTDQSQGDFHVHEASCKDLHRGQMKDHAPMGWKTTASSKSAIITEIYSDIIAENEGNAPYDSWQGYVSDVHFAPCVTLPED